MANHVTYTPALQKLLGGLPNAPVLEPSQDDGLNFGSVFEGALPFAAKAFVSAGMKALEALDLSRQYVAKPILGMGVFINNPGKFQETYGSPLNVNTLRTAWDEAPIPGVAKFALELGFDPMSYLGMGLFKTGGVRFAQAALPIALSKGPKAAMGITAARLKLAGQIDKVPGASKLFEKALAGESVADDVIAKFAISAQKSGLHETYTTALTQMLKTADPAALQGLRNGLLTGMIPTHRAQRVLGLVDSFADGMWATGLSMPAWAISRVPGKQLMTIGFNKAGAFAPIRFVHGLLSKVGPDVVKMQDQMMREGRLGTWWLAPNIMSAERDVQRTAESMLRSLKLFSADSGVDIVGVADDIFYKGGGAFLDNVPFSAAGTAAQAVDERELFRRAVLSLRDEAGGDSRYLNWVSKLNKKEADVARGLEDIIRPIRFGERGVIPDPAVAESLVGSVYGWVDKFIDHAFRPLVTTLNGVAFTIINGVDNASRTGGVAYLKNKNVALDFAMSHGFPVDIGEAAKDTVAEIAIRALKGTANDVSQGLFKMDIAPNLGLAETLAIGGENYVTSLGVGHKNLASRLFIGKFFNDTIRNIDAGAQYHIAAEYATGGFIRRLNNAAAQGDTLGLKTWFDELDAMPFNPALKTYLKDNAAYIIRNPKEGMKMIESHLGLDTIVLDDVMEGLKSAIPEGMWLQAQKFIQTNIDEGLPVFSAMVRGLTQAQTHIAFYADDALRMRGLELGAARKNFNQVMDDMLTPDSVKEAGALLGKLKALRGEAITKTPGFAKADTAGQIKALDERILSIEKQMAEEYTPYAIRTQAALDQDLAVIDGFVGALDAGKLIGEKELKFWQEFKTIHPMASESTDMLVYTQLSHAASATDGLSTPFVMAYENIRLNLSDQIAHRFRRVTTTLTKYKRALQDGNVKTAHSHLSRLVGDHGDFKAPFLKFKETGELPTMVELMATFRGSAESTWYRAQGAKLEFADHMVDLMNKGKWTPADIADAAKKFEMEVFQVGNVAKSRMIWAQKAAAHYGALDKLLPVAQPQRQAIQAQAKELKDMVSKALLTAGEPVDKNALTRAIKTVGQNLTNPGSTQSTQSRLEALVADYLERTGKSADDLFADVRGGDIPNELSFLEADPAILVEADPKFAGLWEEFTQAKNLETNPPIREASEMFLDFQNNYEQLGKFFYNSVRKSLPNQYRSFLAKQMEEAVKRTMGHSLNQKNDIEALQKIKLFINRLVTLGGDKRVSNRVGQMYTEAMINDGLPAMRQLMVDYNSGNNFQRVASAFLPFAAFQLHLPQYLARTFVQRPGLITAMNHFVQEQEENEMFRGGLLFGAIPGAGAMMFAPQLRFSWLPLLAGQNFVRPDDAIQNQIGDMLDLFGFMPGPHVQLAVDTWSTFARQAGIPNAKNADRQMKYGIVPQMRWLQDLTSMMGINNSKGINIPFLGATTDVRERQVQKGVATRVATMIADKRKMMGRDLYPEEVLEIREFVLENNLGEIRKSVSALDFASAMIPGLKTYSETTREVHEKTAAVMLSLGIEGATHQNTVAKYKEMNSLTRAKLLQQVPEFEDILSIPAFSETPADKVIRKSRTSYFGAINSLKSTLSATQKDIDAALGTGQINIIQWREARGKSRAEYGSGLNGLQHVPEFQAIANKERERPTDPADAAWTDFNAITPTDLNNNGFVDQEDLSQFFLMKKNFMANLAPSIRSYIQERQRISFTPLEQEFVIAQDQYDIYRQIPKWVGLTVRDSLKAEDILRDVNTLARLTPGRDTRLELILTMPGLSPEERALAIQAMRLPLNPARLAYWNDKPLMTKFYPDYMPNPESFF